MFMFTIAILLMGCYQARGFPTNSELHQSSFILWKWLKWPRGKRSI
jgi:hypothetical protein